MFGDVNDIEEKSTP